jgi:5-methylcytosine-specific restriction endonuclease McrA
MAKRIKKVLTRNAGTMSESAFWSYIRSTLRQKSRYWKPISLCKANSRRPYKGPLKRQKYEYQCNQCKNWFPDKKINVDHVHPVGTLKSAKDLPFFVENLFCEIDNLQVLCSDCHNAKTKKEGVSRKKSK